MTNEEKINAIIAVLEALDTEDIVRVYNEYARANYYECIYYMCEFDDIMSGYSAYELVDKLGSDFNSRDNYFWFDGLGLISSSDYPEESEIFSSDMARYCIRSNDDLGLEDIADILEDENEEEK